MSIDYIDNLAEGVTDDNEVLNRFDQPTSSGESLFVLLQGLNFSLCALLHRMRSDVRFDVSVLPSTAAELKDDGDDPYSLSALT